MDKMYMCEYCFELYSEKDAKKNQYRCTCEETNDMEEIPFLVPIDKSIAKDIQKMNKKGWITQFCCAGHICTKEEYVNDFYVIFKIDNELQLELIPFLLKNEPFGMCYTIERNRAYYNSELLSYQIGIRQIREYDPLFDVGYLKKEFDSKEEYQQELEKVYNKLILPKVVSCRKSFHEWVNNILPDLNEIKNMDLY